MYQMALALDSIQMPWAYADFLYIFDIHTGLTKYNEWEVNNKQSTFLMTTPNMDEFALQYFSAPLTHQYNLVKFS